MTQTNQALAQPDAPESSESPTSDETILESPAPAGGFLDKPVLAFWSINWELVLYALIFIVAVTTRFYDLGARVMSHDESLHALYAFKLYEGDGYRHDPLMHGPLQFHLVALSYLLFGDNDFSARIPAALFGVALVMLPYWFRPWLGRVGALVASFGLLISPMTLYYDRYIRNEAFLTLLMGVMVLSLFQYMRHRQQRWLYIGALAVSLSLATKAVGYINGFIGLTFIVAVYMWETLPQRLFRQVYLGLGVALLISLVAEIAISINAAGSSAVEPSRLWGILLVLIGMLSGVLFIARNIDRTNRPLSSTVKPFFNLKTATALLAGPVIISIVIFFLLYTTFFTNPNGFVSSTWGMLSYWLGQHEVNRGSQPLYYYLMLMPLYEFLPFIIGLVAAIIYTVTKAPAHLSAWARDRGEDTEDNPNGPHPADGGTFAAFLVYWALLTFVIFSWAGEKMPWLTAHITVPFIFLMGHAAQTALNRFEWRTLTTRRGLVFTGLVPLLGVAGGILLFTRPFQGQSLSQINETLQFFVALVAGVAIAFGLWWFGRQLGGEKVKPIIFLVLFSLMSLLTIRFAWLSSFVNYDYVNEFLVYAHGAPDVKWALEQIDEISQRTVGDNQIKVAYGGVIWPKEWYMRNYPNRAFFGSNPNRNDLDAPVILLSPDPEVSLDEVEPYLGDNYERFRYRQVWWPIETYKNQTFRTVFHDYIWPAPVDEAVALELGQTVPTDPRAEIRDNWNNLWHIFFYREHLRNTLNEWPYKTEMYFYVRKDIAAQMWDYQTGSVALAEPEVDPYTERQIDLPALELWGSLGVNEGQFDRPHAIDVSPQGQVYVGDSGNRRVQVFDQQGNFLKAWQPDIWQSIPSDQLFEIWGLAVSDEGLIYVSDTWNHRILAFNEDGELQFQFGQFGNTENDPLTQTGNFWGPRDIAIDNEGNLYIADTGNKRIQKFAPDGTFLNVVGGGGLTPGRFEEPVGLAFDSAGNLYVADTWNRRIQKFNSDLQALAEWEVTAWESENAINKPYLAIDSQDRLYVTDPEGYRVIVFNTAGTLLGTFGQFGQDFESFRLPLDVAVAEDDSLFVIDHANNRVMKFRYP